MLDTYGYIESAEELVGEPAVPAPAPRPWIVWSNQKRAWVGPGGGLAISPKYAKRFTEAEARAICENKFRPSSVEPEDVMLLAPEVSAELVHGVLHG
jgi:hypothetical protein